MRVHLLSDLHLEQDSFSPPAVDADLVVLAGDVARGTRGVDWARRLARGRPVAYVAGNHEFYGHTLPALISELRQAAAASPVRLLENDELVVDGVRLLGCTLWSDFDFGGPEHRADSMELCARLVNDYEHITYGPGNRKAATTRHSRAAPVQPSLAGDAAGDPPCRAHRGSSPITPRSSAVGRRTRGCGRSRVRLRVT